jgi:ribosomal protein S21
MAYRRNSRKSQDYRGYENRNRNYRDFDKTPPSKRPVHISIRPKPGEHIERAIRRFMKKTKKEKVLETYREKTDCFKKPSEIRRRKTIRKEALLKKQKLEEKSKQ